MWITILDFIFTLYRFMDRRKALRNILLGTGAAVFSVSGYKWYGITKRAPLPDLANYKGLLPELAETIIPATDTPGAKDANVGEFIYKMVVECTDVKSQNKFLSGLQDLEHYCHSKYDVPFEKCTTEQRETILNHFEKEGKPYPGILGKIQHKFLGDPFFVTLKKYTVAGYCSSEQGATKGLAYDYIPGGFVACMPLKPGQRSWATK